MLETLLNVLDTPGAATRNMLAGRNPLINPLSGENRVSGRDLLRQYGLAGNQDTWGNWLGGMAAEMALDPTNLIGGGLLANTVKRLGRVKAANRGIEAANKLSLAQRAQGFMPEEIARLTKAVGENGLPHPVRVINEDEMLDTLMNARPKPPPTSVELPESVQDVLDNLPDELFDHSSEQSRNIHDLPVSYVDTRNPLYSHKHYRPLPTEGGMLEGRFDTREQVKRVRDLQSHIAGLKSDLYRTRNPDKKNDYLEHINHMQGVLANAKQSLGQQFSERNVGSISGLNRFGHSWVNDLPIPNDAVMYTKPEIPFVTAIDPADVYKPHIANELQQLQQQPSMSPYAAMAPYNILARQPWKER